MSKSQQNHKQFGLGNADYQPNLVLLPANDAQGQLDRCYKTQNLRCRQIRYKESACVLSQFRYDYPCYS